MQSPAIETMTLTAKGAADDKVVIIDIRLGPLTYSVFSLGSLGLPLPHQLPVDKEYPVNIHFSPEVVALYTGSVEIDIENEEGGVDTEVRDIVGIGCDDASPEGCD